MFISDEDTLTINNAFKAFDKFLKDYQNEEGYLFTESFGLCTNIFDMLEDDIINQDLANNVYYIAHKLFESWEHFTGSLSYPVPFRLDKVQDKYVLRVALGFTIRHVYSVAYDTQYNKYDKTTDYGLLRRDLYQHIKDNIFNVIAEI